MDLAGLRRLTRRYRHESVDLETRCRDLLYDVMGLFDSRQDREMAHQLAAVPLLEVTRADDLLRLAFRTMYEHTLLDDPEPYAVAFDADRALRYVGHHDRAIDAASNVKVAGLGSLDDRPQPFHAYRELDGAVRSYRGFLVLVAGELRETLRPLARGPSGAVDRHSALLAQVLRVALAQVAPLEVSSSGVGVTPPVLDDLQSERSSGDESAFMPAPPPDMVADDEANSTADNADKSA